jgi:acyl-coenzyme A synthetase/AMP-(fatty) acid ligase
MLSAGVGPSVLPADAAYVMFTSGSTGSPLAVVGPETALTVFFRWYARRFGLTATDRFSVLAGLSHDPLLRETLLPLWLGATVCLPPAPAESPGEVVRWLRETNVTVVHLTPARARLLAAAAAGMTVPAVRLAAIAAAPVTEDAYQALRELFPRARRIGLYGTTETPQGVSLADLDAEFAGENAGYPPLGAGSPSAELGVLGPGNAPAAVNEIGEVYVRSPYLALGYLNEPGLSAAQFTRETWTGDTSVRVYRTGDIGRYRPDRSVEFLGRLDDQVSVGGYRVEPAEIERALREHAAVADCAVAVADETLAAAVLPRRSVSSEALLRHLAARLPEPMVPRRIGIVSHIPVTPNGKVDSQALDALLRRTPAVGAAPNPGHESLISNISDVWRQVLGIETVDPDATFFALGGTSFTLLQAQQLLQSRLSRQIGLIDLFRYPTARLLASALNTGGSAVGGSPRQRSTAEKERRRRRLAVARQQARQASLPGPGPGGPQHPDRWPGRPLGR